MMEQDTLVWNDTDVAVASQHILNSEVYDIAGGMQERSKELRLTVSWTQSKSQIQDSCQRRTMLACKRRLTTSKVHEDSHPPLLVAFPNCNTHREQQHKEEHKVQLYSGKPLSIKLYVPGSVESIPIIRHKTLKTTNKPAMHRKSKSKSKFQAFNNLTPLCSSSKSQPSAKQSSALVEAGIESKASPHFLGKKRIKNRNCFLSSPQTSPVRWKMMIPFPTFGATSFVTLLTLICMETVLLSTMSSCAKTFYMHWNTSNSIFRIDNTDHIIDVNKGNLAFEFDQVHIICPVYEPGTFENETEKYIIYNVSKVEYETCRITNADPRVIAICDKPQKLMFFTITFRPFTPQPGGLEFLPGNDYYFIYDHHHYNKHPNEVVKNEELTYNSGTATSDGLFFALWTWIFSTLSLSSIQSCHLRAYWINSSFLFSIFAILGIHYFVQSTFQTTLRYRPEMVKITATTKNGLFCQKADLFKYDR
ncbi:uncharacterized protein LOC6523732 isoform X5 [Drosophila yakuba]|uniref:uncharacterized protein LOC6523732 isoform X5 n=1 Tax=Drosophila yakuba TaxID=7245 RepID=UPI0019308A9B|nr:uncharacterized protein LOC6523732 isoform X5 [Drosophila yakuba]